MRNAAIIAIALTVLAPASPEAAQVNQAPLKTIKCTFTEGVYTKVDTSGKRDVTKAVKETSEMVFDQIDDVAHSARLIGNIGVDNVSVERLGNVLHLFDYTAVGGMIAFTVIDLDKISRAAPVRAIESRHILSADFRFHSAQPEIQASQYYGTCIRFD